MYAELNACMRKRLGACMRRLGACMRKRLGAKYADVGCKVYGAVWVHVYAFWVHVYTSVGCMYADVGCKVYGDVWVQSICLLGASLIRLLACLIVGSLPDSR